MVSVVSSDRPSPKPILNPTAKKIAITAVCFAALALVVTAVAAAILFSPYVAALAASVVGASLVGYTIYVLTASAAVAVGFAGVAVISLVYAKRHRHEVFTSYPITPVVQDSAPSAPISSSPDHLRPRSNSSPAAFVSSRHL